MFNTKRKHFLKPSRFIKNALRFNYLRATDAIAPRNWRLQIRAILAEGTLLLNLHILVPDIVHPYAAPQWRLSAPAASRGSRVQGMHAWRTPWCDSFLSRDWPPGPRTLVHVFVTCWNFSFFLVHEASCISIVPSHIFPLYDMSFLRFPVSPV